MKGDCITRCYAMTWMWQPERRFATLLLFLRELQIGCLRLGISCSLSSILWGLGLNRGTEHS